MSLKVVQISDTHISVDAPQRLIDLENCVNAINALDNAPDVVVHTGDIAHDALDEEYHSARELLERLDAPYFVMPGNRDQRAKIQKTFSETRYQLPSGPWIQYAVDEYPVRLIMVDTISTESNKGKLCDERLANLEKLLIANTDKPTVLFLHHPPYEAIGIPDPYQYEDWSDVEKLSKLLTRFNNIKGLYCGHVHRFIDGEIAGINASAITCSAGDLRKGDVSDDERLLPVYKLITLC